MVLKPKICIRNLLGILEVLSSMDETHTHYPIDLSFGILAWNIFIFHFIILLFIGIPIAEWLRYV